MRAFLVQNMQEKYAEFGEICGVYAAYMLHICGITEICGVNDACACVYVRVRPIPEFTDTTDTDTLDLDRYRYRVPIPIPVVTAQRA